MRMSGRSALSTSHLHFKCLGKEPKEGMILRCIEVPAQLMGPGNVCLHSVLSRLWTHERQCPCFLADGETIVITKAFIAAPLD